jgi:hypothetical protein
VHSRKFPEHFNHAPVIFQRMEARPREHVTPGRGIPVLRLVHVPD